MTRSIFDQETQVHSSGSYDDTIAPSLANWETGVADLEGDLNSLRSAISLHLDGQSGDWYDDLNTPAALGAGSKRGINDLNTDLHLIERKRFIDYISMVGVDIVVPAAQQYVILGAGKLPNNTTAAIGVVTTEGAVCAYNSAFGTATLDEVVGPTSLDPKNLVRVVDGATRDPILDSSDREIMALLQSESNTDGATITTTTPNRAQLSFVVVNATGDDLELAAAADIAGKTIDYAYSERFAFDDLTETQWRGSGFVDGGAANTDRQGAYDNQGVTPVDLTTNATLDLEGAGLEWIIRDDTEANLLRVIEGSAGGTSEVEFGAAVDVFDNNAITNDFAGDLKVDSGGVEIDIGVTAGSIETTGANDLRVSGAGELYLDDGNQTGSTWAQVDGIKLSETTAEWDNFETEFGEVSLLNAIVQANGSASRSKGVATVTADIAADTNVTGAGGTPNLSAQLPDYSGVTFVDDVDVFVNGQLQWNGANAAANNDVYPGDTPANGDLKFEYALKYRGGSNPDVITSIVWG